MVVLTFPHLLPQTPLLPRVALPPPARHIHRLIQIRSPSWPPPAVLSFAPIRRAPCSSARENGASETLEEKDAAAEEEAFGKKNEDEEQAAVSASIEARKNSSLDLWGGVAEEVREIEWPAFGRVLSTTGVVLAVIAGSSIALLTVNLILAEVSDRIFAGRGIQDFFG